MLEHDLVGGEEGDACCKSCHVQFVYVSGTFFFFFCMCVRGLCACMARQQTTAKRCTFLVFVLDIIWHPWEGKER